MRDGVVRLGDGQLRDQITPGLHLVTGASGDRGRGSPFADLLAQVVHRSLDVLVSFGLLPGRVLDVLRSVPHGLSRLVGLPFHLREAAMQLT